MPFPNKDTQFKPGQSGNPAGKPKGRKSLSTMVRDLLENEIDWSKIPLKNSDEFKAKFNDDGILAGEVLVRSALAEAMGKGGSAAREWLRKSGYGDKLQLGGDEDNPAPILGGLNLHTNDSTEEDSSDEDTPEGSAGGNERGEDDSDSVAADPDSPDQEASDQRSERKPATPQKRGDAGVHRDTPDA